MIYSVTSLHLSCIYHFDILDHTLNSLISNGIDKCFVSISFDDLCHYRANEINIINLETKYGDKVDFYVQHEFFFQFQHLQFLCNKLKKIAYSDDSIVFCNDDVILMEPLPIAEHEIIAGAQYISDVTEIGNKYYNWSDIANYSKHGLTIDNNFSGSVCPFNIFEMFFKLNKFDFTTTDDLIKAKNQLIDVEFINYWFFAFINKLEIYKPEKPFMFQRIWMATKSELPKWRMILSDGFYKCAKNLDTISQYNKKQQYKQYIKYGSLISFGFGCGYLLAKLKR
jgi:hypothetical protein